MATEILFFEGACTVLLCLFEAEDHSLEVWAEAVCRQESVGQVVVVSRRRHVQGVVKISLTFSFVQFVQQQLQSVHSESRIENEN